MHGQYWLKLSKGKTPEEVIEIILTYPGAGGGNPNDTDNRGGSGLGHRGGPGGNPMPGPYGTGLFADTPLSMLRGDAGYRLPERRGTGAPDLAGFGPYQWNLPSVMADIF